MVVDPKISQGQGGRESKGDSSGGEKGGKQATTYEKVNPKGPPVNEGRGNEQNMQTVGERKTCEILNNVKEKRGTFKRFKRTQQTHTKDANDHEPKKRAYSDIEFEMELETLKKYKMEIDSGDGADASVNNAEKDRNGEDQERVTNEKLKAELNAGLSEQSRGPK